MGHSPCPNETGRPLRVGYVSTGFYASPGLRFFLPILENHSADSVEVYLYATGPRRDRETLRLKRLARHWCDVTEMSDGAAAALMRSHGVDVLVDMDGHSNGSRLMIFAHRGAPVQVSYHGAFASSGLANMDYRLADSVLCPPGEIPSGPEQIVRMHGCFYAYCPWPEAPDVTLSPARRTGVVTFGIMHRIQKWTPICLDLWCRVLHAVPDSRAVVNAHDALKFGVKDVYRPFAARGIDCSRIIIPLKAATTADYLHLYDNVDIFLDAFPFSGATTVCDALWQGVPVVTLRGKSFLGRMSESILSGAGCQSWVAATRAEYVALAADMSRNTSHLAHERNALRPILWQSPLMDGARVAKELERIYHELWAWHLAKPVLTNGACRGKKTCR